ncbi:MAG: tRNA-dihydrouridine synthase family protein [Candidatus Pacebacteria bacterium]|nr:tRNA-dihydrouridine synthase family protein [Candidatus Paceibacterota bacterium]
MNFWEKLRDARDTRSEYKTAAEPFFALAPMADVTDPAFRSIIAKYGKPDVMWTEFVSADGLMLGGRDHLIRDLVFTEAERPIVAQLFGSNPETMRAAAKLCTELGFDGIDINMGCPDKSIEKQGAGAATIKTPDVAVAIIRAAKAGIADAVAGAENNASIKTIPLSVKTRIGYNKNEIETWIPTLLREDLAAVTVHCRTRKEMSSVPARWEYIQEVTALRDKIAPQTLVIGNGDVRDMGHGRELAQKFGADGVMIGRSIFGNPWLFAKSQEKTAPHSYEKKLKNMFSHIKNSFAQFLQTFFGIKNRYWLRAAESQGIAKEDRLRVLVEHCKLYEELLGDIKSFSIMKKHFKAYVNGWAGSKELRMELMEAKNAADVERIINSR